VLALCLFTALITPDRQEQLLASCAALTAVKFPAAA
jgi:hypothetical protein